MLRSELTDADLIAALRDEGLTVHGEADEFDDDAREEYDNATEEEHEEALNYLSRKRSQ